VGEFPADCGRGAAKFVSNRPQRYAGRGQVTDRLVDGEVYAWTAKAVKVTWKDGLVTYRTWVWSSAVTRQQE
jgi:hypothetical protein